MRGRNKNRVGQKKQLRRSYFYIVKYILRPFGRKVVLLDTLLAYKVFLLDSDL